MSTPNDPHKITESEPVLRPSLEVPLTTLRDRTKELEAEITRLKAEFSSFDQRAGELTLKLANAKAEAAESFRAQASACKADEARLRWLHTGSGKDLDGYEWGIYRVKWNQHGQLEAAWHTNSDFSDLDAEMKRESDSARAASKSP